MGDVKDEGAPEGLPPSYETTTQVSDTPGPPAPPQFRRSILPLNLPVLTSLRNKRVILASASPRRKQLLAQVALNHPDASGAM
jgi:hypothetical protein